MIGGVGAATGSLASSTASSALKNPLAKSAIENAADTAVGTIDDLAHGRDVTVKSIASDFGTGMILSGANEYVSTPKVENEIKRSTWRQSEKDAAKDFPEYREQVSLKKEDGIVKEVPYGTKGSVRPDLYKEGHSIDIKNYNISTSSGRSSLKRNINKQYNQRLDNLPEDTLQTVIIDIRGQDVPKKTIKQLADDLRTANPLLDVRFKK